MATSRNTSRQEDPLNGSWEELTYKSQLSVESDSSSAIEKLLYDAQRETSSSASVASNEAKDYAYSASPRSFKSTTSDTPPNLFHVEMLQSNREAILNQMESTDWVWDWSSRPEITPPWGSTRNVEPFRHPVSKKRTFSIRRSRMMQMLMNSFETLPFLIFTHACTFILGAATMVVILKKYYRCVSLSIPALD